MLLKCSRIQLLAANAQVGLRAVWRRYNAARYHASDYRGHIEIKARNDTETFELLACLDSVSPVLTSCTKPATWAP